MSRLIILICFTSLVLSNVLQTALAKETLRILVSPQANANNNNFRTIYHPILSDIFAQQYIIKPINSNSSAIENYEPAIIDLFISHQPPNEQLQKDQIKNDSWLRSAYNIDTSEAAYVLYDQDRVTIEDANDLKQLVVATALNNAWFRWHNLAIEAIQLNDLTSAKRLIAIRKIDAVVLTGEQVYLANHNSSYKVDLLIDSQPIYLYFPNNEVGKKLKKQFEQGMLTLINSGNIRQLVNDDALLTKANIKLTTEKKVIHWHMVPKIYNPRSNTLDVSHMELAFSATLSDLLPQYHLETTIISGQQAQYKLTSNNATCVMNAIKIDKDNIYKSSLTYQFLQPQIFHYQEDNPLFSQTTPINLVELLEKRPQFVLGISSNNTIAKKLEAFLPAKLFQRIKQFEPFNYQQMVNMFLARRIDAIIIWPSLLQALLPNKDQADQFQSQRLAGELFDDIPTFIACNEAPEHQQFIEQVNQLLQDPETRSKLFSSYFEGLDPATQHRLLEKLAR